MASIALPLTNLLLGLGNIGAGLGLSEAEKLKQDELTKKAQTLKTTVAYTGNLYDHIYYLVAVNLDRVKKALDEIPSDFLEKVQKQITSDISEGDAEKAIQTVAKVLGYTEGGVGIVSSILKIVIKLRQRKASGEEPPEPTADPFDNVPVDGDEPVVPTEPESSFSESPKLTMFSKGLDIGGVVFGLAGLATTIGLGIWTLDKLNKAISDVEKKQKQMDAYKKSMTDALNSLVKDAGLPDKSYDELKKMAATWLKISEHFDSYQTTLNYAITGYYQNKSLASIKAKVNSESDGDTPFPEDGYPLAEALAGDIKYKHDHKKTPEEICNFFTNGNPKLGLRFRISKYFITTLVNPPW